VASSCIAVRDRLIQQKNCASCIRSRAAVTSSTNILSMQGKQAVMSFIIGWLGLMVLSWFSSRLAKKVFIAVPGSQHQ
jgi:hypothetical protein